MIAVGNPYGWSSSVTSGIVSALDRRLDRDANISNISDFIQTDAGINPGNSGGALVNLSGEVIGINTWITSPTGGSIGIGFAVPINNVKKFVHDIVTAGQLQYGWVGVSIARLINREAEKELGIQDTHGAFVNYVIKKSPAWQGGIQPGDFITAVNGHPVADESHFIQLVSELEVDSLITVTLIRLGKERMLSFHLAPRPPENTISAMSELSWPGFVVLPLSGELRERYRIESGATGVVVSFVEQGTPGFLAGLHAGDIITRIGDASVTSLPEFYRSLNQTHSAPLTLTVIRNGGREEIQLAP
ncbi:MAG TPA: PDZ domain-containing protein [Spirochaetia bacterium]|nr:PDZ domain-containing protein [Spirochaetia bacterium]